MDLYRLARRARNGLLTQLVRRDFDHFGRGSSLDTPFHVWGEHRIWIGDSVRVGEDSWLHALGPDGRIVIGHGTRMSGHAVISAAQSVRLAEKVLVARGVYIADHNHGRADSPTAILDQGIADISPVEIGPGVWLGHNVVVLPGSHIGRGAVIAAGAVVRGEVPPRTVAAGAPARVIKELD
jgi:acetyltransferase-like isoleucine patch superfamily enzyme